MKKIIKDERVNTILKTFENFGIKMESVEIMSGPVISFFVFKLITPTRMKDLDAFDRDLNHALGVSDVKIYAPIRNTSLIGVEVPDKERQFVQLKDMLKTKEFSNSENKLLIPFGRTIGSKDLFLDTYKLPHLFISGMTGTGKSNFLHCTINSLIGKLSPDELKLILVDPKRVELSLYSGIPHLLAPVIVENEKSISALRWLNAEMERRYRILVEADVRNIDEYNKKSKEKLPYILYIIDEVADIFYAQKKELENFSVRILQMGRAVGCHMIMATSRPSKDIMRSMMAVNITSRLCFKLCCASDSKEVIWREGAEKLLGEGDALLFAMDDVNPVRIQTPRISEKEVISNVKNVKNKYGVYEEQREDDDLLDTMGEDYLYDEAKEIVIKNGKASSSFLQRKLKVGYSRAAHLIDMLEANGVIGEANGSEPRQVLVKK